jgi:hypothetical protein
MASSGETARRLMTKTDLEPEDEKPLDPATERLRRKMLRLLAVSVGTLIVAVMAVLGAVVYKVSSRAPAVPEGPAPTLALDVPQGSSIEDMALGEGQALLRLRDGEGQVTLQRIDLSTGRTLARYTLPPS